MNDSLLTLLGFARKAGKLDAGFCAVAEAVRRKKSKLVVVASDISQKSEKEIRYIAADKVPVARVDYNMEQLFGATGRKAGIFSINEHGFAQSVLKSITGGNAGYDKN